MFIVNIGCDADNAHASRDHGLHHRIGPAYPVANGLLIWEHALRYALADDDHRLGAATIGIVEIASGNDRNAERCEESGRNRAQLRARITSARRRNVTIDREFRC